MIHKVLAIETSCDDTSVAIVDHQGFVHALVSANQDLVHEPFGGVVPEIASRNHTSHLLPLIDECLRQSELSWSQIEGIAVTSRPGLIGSLLVGVVTAKTLAYTYDLPLIGVNHLESHIVSPLLKDQSYQPSEGFSEPFICLAVSGGHTHLYHVVSRGEYYVLGQTIDDAAGEAFDKFAKMLGLGFPGGLIVDQYAKQGDSKAFQFPRPLLREESYKFSFSGLKTSAQRKMNELTENELKKCIYDLCASYQEAIVDVLMAKLDRAVTNIKIKNVAIAGGVSANSRLRARAQQWSDQRGLDLLMPPLRFCTDNAAMVGLAGIWRLNRGERSDISLSPSPRVLPGDFVDDREPKG